MKQQIIILFILFISVFCSKLSYSAVTTIDGVITLDFYEDTESGISNRWILEFTMNNINPDIFGGWFDMTFWDNTISFENEYNEASPYFTVSKYFPTSNFEEYVQNIDSVGKPMIPVGTSFPIYGVPNKLFYQTEGIELTPIIGTIDITLNGDSLQLTGPIGFTVTPIPEPVGMSLFAFGAFLLRFLLKRK